MTLAALLAQLTAIRDQHGNMPVTIAGADGREEPVMFVAVTEGRVLVAGDVPFSLPAE
jgi:hypothetical protein